MNRQNSYLEAQQQMQQYDMQEMYTMQQQNEQLQMRVDYL
jgi:hypothetical protein